MERYQVGPRPAFLLYMPPGARTRAGLGRIRGKPLQKKEIEAIVVPEMDTLGFELIKLEVVGSASNPVVRMYIDRPGGVTIGDCAMVSRTVGLLLEEADPFPGRYLLEVSSPGSNRPLVTAGHFEAYAGEMAKVVARAAGERITYTGTIASCINDVVTLRTADGDASVHLDDVISAQLVHQEYKIDKKRSKEKRSKKRRGGS